MRLPVIHAMGSASDGDEFAAGTGLLHLVAHFYGLLIGHVFVLRTMNQKVRRHVFVDVDDRGCLDEGWSGIGVNGRNAE